MSFRNKLQLVVTLSCLFISPLLISVAPAFGAGSLLPRIVQGGTLTVGMTTEPRSLETMTAGFAAAAIGGQIIDTLLLYNRNVQLSPNLATSWSADPSKGTYTFQLRHGVTWHDGVPFTAADVKFSFEQVIPVFGIYGALYFKNSTVQVVDDYTAVLKPGKFWPGAQLTLFAANDGCPIFPEHILKGQNLLKSDWIMKPIGTGPFVFKNWVQGNYIQLDRNPNYWDKSKPYLDHVVFQFFSDPAAAVASLQKGDIGYVWRGLPASSYDTLKGNPNLNAQLNPRPPYNNALWINTKAPYLSDVRVRQAISYAINRADLVAKAELGQGNAQQYMIDPSLVPPSPTLTTYNFDPAKANQLLDSAGYAKAANGTRFSIQLMTRTSEPDELLISQLLKDELANVGINVNIKAVDFGTYLALQAQLNYQIATIKYNSINVWMYLLFSTNQIAKGPFTNNFQYSSPAMDSLLNQWLTANAADGVKLMQQMEDLVSQDLPEIILFGVVWMNVWNKDYTGNSMPIGNYGFSDPFTEVYSQKAQPAPTTQPSSTQSGTTSAPTTVSAAPDFTTPLAGVIIIILIAAAAIFYMRRRKKPGTTG